MFCISLSLSLYLSAPVCLTRILVFLLLSVQNLCSALLCLSVSFLFSLSLSLFDSQSLFQFSLSLSLSVPLLFFFIFHHLLIYPFSHFVLVFSLLSCLPLSIFPFSLAVSTNYHFLLSRPPPLSLFLFLSLCSLSLFLTLSGLLVCSPLICALPILE